jgi:hypothetical protein
MLQAAAFLACQFIKLQGPPRCQPLKKKPAVAALQLLPAGFLLSGGRQYPNLAIYSDHLGAILLSKLERWSSASCSFPASTSRAIMPRAMQSFALVVCLCAWSSWNNFCPN